MLRDFLKLFARAKRSPLLPFKPLVSINSASERRKMPASLRKDPDIHKHPAHAGAQGPDQSSA